MSIVSTEKVVERSLETKQLSTLSTLLRRQAVLTLLAFTLLCVVVWIGASVYFSSRNTSIAPNVQKQLLPIAPVFDLTTLRTLRDRRPYTTEELAEFPVVRELIQEVSGRQVVEVTLSTPAELAASASAQQRPAPTPIPSPSPSPNPSPTATGSAEPTAN